MDPDRKRKIRLVVALSAAVLLAVALVYTSISAGSEAREPSQVLADGPSDKIYRLTGKVESFDQKAGGLEFDITDRDGTGESLPVDYTGQVPDPFREGREVIVTGTYEESGVFLAEKDSLITKCPSKFAEEAENDPAIQIIEEE